MPVLPCFPCHKRILLCPAMLVSAALTAMGIVVLKILNILPYCSFKALAVVFARFVRISASVRTMPSIFSLGLICFRTLPIVFISCIIPFAGKYCACTGMITLSDAANVLIVSIDSDGGQSIMMWSYSCLNGARQLCRANSLLIAFTKLISVPESSRLAGIRSIPSLWCRIAVRGLISSSFITFSMMFASVVFRTSVF